MKKISIVSFAILALGARGQEPEISTHDTPSTFTTRVTLVSVPVVVRDGKGRVVGNLKKEDFQLLDKGKAQVISRFSMESASAKRAEQAASLKTDAGEPSIDASTLPTRFIAYVFDDMHASVPVLTQARDAALKQLANPLAPGERIAVYSTSGKVTLEFTHDVEAASEAVRKIQPRASVTADKMDCPPISYYQADRIQNQDPTAMEAARQDGQRCNPTPSDLRSRLDDSLATAFRMKSEGDRDNGVTLTTINSVLGKLASVPGERIMVLFSPGFYIAAEHRSGESALIDAAIRTDVAINTVDARELLTTSRLGDASQGYATPQNTSQSYRYALETAQAESETLADFATGTGGAWIRNNDLAGGLQRIAAVPESHYILGFSPQNLKLDGSFHALRVTVNGKEMTVQARRGYYAPKHVLNEAEQAEEDIREAFYSRDEETAIPLAIQSQFFKPSADAAKVSVVGRIDLRPLRFKKADGRNLDTVTVVTGLFDLNGNVVGAFSKTFDLKFKDETLGTRAAAAISSKINFDVPPGKYLIRLVVRDSEGQMMGAKNGAVEIP